MRQPNKLRDRFFADLNAWLTPELLYHCFTGENDPQELERISKLDHVLQTSLIEKVERLWPERLKAISAARRKEKQQFKQSVQLYVFNQQHDKGH